MTETDTKQASYEFEDDNDLKFLAQNSTGMLLDHYNNDEIEDVKIFKNPNPVSV